MKLWTCPECILVFDTWTSKTKHVRYHIHVLLLKLDLIRKQIEVWRHR